MLSTLFSETSSPTSFQLDCLAIVITESYFPAPNTGVPGVHHHAHYVAPRHPNSDYHAYASSTSPHHAISPGPVPYFPSHLPAGASSEA